ncbi:MAG: Kelch repeat-containing protein [Myxococcaceae bacterium]
MVNLGGRLALLSMALCAACDHRDDPRAPIAVRGVVQKGPLLVGTPVLVSKVESNGDISDLITLASIEDSVGAFSFQMAAPGAVELVATGYFFNEVTGDVSAGTLTLKGLSQIQPGGDQHANLNVLTHITSGRVRELMRTQQLDVAAASLIAQAELVAALQSVLPIQDPGSFAALDLYGGATSGLGNAYLLALSAALFKYADIEAAGGATSAEARLSLLLNLLERDLADDGLIGQAGFLDKLTIALRQLHPDRIAENLANRCAIDHSQPLPIPDISPFFGLCAGTMDCPWRAGAPMPAASRGHGAAAYDGKLYAFGGVTDAGFATVRVYDPYNNAWTPRANMPTGLYSLGAHEIGGLIYLFGGYGTGGFNNSVLQYHPANDTWVSRAPLPTHRYTFMREAVGGKVYVIGGQGPADDCGYGPGWPYKDCVQIYDPVADAWSNGTPAPTPLAAGESCALDDKIYVFAAIPTMLTYVYDVAADAWATRTPAPVAREGGACVVHGGQMWLLGGRALAGAGATLDVIEVYDPATDSWADGGYMPTPRLWFSANELDGRLYLAGGGQVPIASFDILDWALLQTP